MKNFILQFYLVLIYTDGHVPNFILMPIVSLGLKVNTTKLL